MTTSLTTTTTADGPALIGQVVRYSGSVAILRGARCVVVDYKERRGRYVIEPLAVRPDLRHHRLDDVRRTSIMCTGDTRPVCPCGHFVRHNLPDVQRCIRCECTTHRDRLAIADDGALTDEELFRKVATGHETIIRDHTGRPVSVVVPFDAYMEARTAAAFHRV